MNRAAKATLHAVANLVALTAYRNAFKAGRLGRAHSDVVREVYGMAAAGLLAMRRQAWRVAAVWAALGVALSLTSAVMGMPRGGWLAQLGIVAGSYACLRIGGALAYGNAARLLAPPPIVEPVESVGDPCGHVWEAPFGQPHVCNVEGDHEAGKHQCSCGFWITLGPALTTEH